MERRLEARDVEAIFREFAKVMSELPPDTEAGWLDAEGDLRLAPDIGRKLRTARPAYQKRANWSPFCGGGRKRVVSSG